MINENSVHLAVDVFHFNLEDIKAAINWAMLYWFLNPGEIVGTGENYDAIFYFLVACAKSLLTLAAPQNFNNIESSWASMEQRWANNSVFEYIRIVRTEYIRKSNYSVLFKNRIIFVFVFGRYFQTEYIRIRIRLLFFNRIYSYSYSDSVNIRIIFVF